MNAPFIYVRRPYAQRGAALRRASAMRAAKKKRAGPAGRGDVRRAGGGCGRPGGGPPPPPPRPPPPPPPPPVTASFGALGALGRRSAKRCAFQKNEKYNLSLKLSKKQLFILWTHDQGEGKLERENLRFAVIIHFKRLSGLEAHTTSYCKWWNY